MQRMLFPLTAIGLAALVALGARCVQSESDPASRVVAPTEAPRVLPTNFPTPGALPPWLSVATGTARNAEEAASFAREALNFRPPFFREAEPDSLQYVIATVGDARDILDPSRDTKVWDTPDDVPAVIFVAKGEFEMTPPVALNRPTYTVTQVWVVVPLGEKGTWMTPYDKEYDLSQLGQVHEVPLPLAPFPTPVSLGTPEADVE